MAKVSGFNKEKMERLAGKDKYIGFMFKDMVKNGSDEGKALKALYNSEVVDGNSQMREAYDNA